MSDHQRSGPSDLNVTGGSPPFADRFSTGTGQQLQFDHGVAGFFGFVGRKVMADPGSRITAP